MPVPKTAMNEDDLTIFGEDKVWFARKAGDMQAKSVTARVHNAPHQYFRLRVLASDERHPFASLNPA
jgi:hypothetical protein